MSLLQRAKLLRDTMDNTKKGQKKDPKTKGNSENEKMTKMQKRLLKTYQYGSDTPTFEPAVPYLKA